MFQQSARESAARWSADAHNWGALESLSRAEDGAAATLEQLGDLPQALRLRRSAYTHALTLFHADSTTASNRERLQASRADAVRSLWLTAGETGDYRPLFEIAAPTREQVHAAVAESWTNLADLLTSLANPVAARLDASAKAVDLSRQLTAGSPSAAHRLALARSLRSAGDAFREAAHSASGSESLDAYGRSQECYQEALRILDGLEQSGSLPAAESAALVSVTNHLAGAGERLGLQAVQKTMPRR
jgi:hypothetical protein